MDHRDPFHSLFGFPGSPFGRRGFDEDRRHEEDSAEQHDLFGRSGFGAFGQSAPFNEMNDMFRGAETMLRHMDSMFRDMNMNMSGSGPSFQQITDLRNEEDEYRRRTPRDEMLKVPDSASESGEIVQYTGHPRREQMQPRSPTRSFSQSSMTSFVGLGDGKIQQRRTVRNPDGSTSTTVTQRLGDRELNITTKIDPNGEKEVIEDLVNMDEDEREDFQLEWSGDTGSLPQLEDSESTRRRQRRSDSGEVARYDAPILDPKGPSIFERLFGSWG